MIVLRYRDVVMILDTKSLTGLGRIVWKSIITDINFYTGQFSSGNSRLRQVPQRSWNKNFWWLVVWKFLQTGYPSCHPDNSLHALVVDYFYYYYFLQYKAALRSVTAPYNWLYMLWCHRNHRCIIIIITWLCHPWGCHGSRSVELRVVCSFLCNNDEQWSSRVNSW